MSEKARRYYTSILTGVLFGVVMGVIIAQEVGSSEPVNVEIHHSARH